MNKKIIVNTLALYSRQALVVLINLYVVRIVLNELGVSDYGVYNVILGVTAIFSFIPSAMTVSVQRQFVFSIEKGRESLKRCFSSCLVIYLLMIALSSMLFFTFGSFFVKEYLVIPEQRLSPALTLFYFSIVIFILSIATSLLTSLVISHENMKVYAILSVIEALLKLMSAFILAYEIEDKLITYGALVMLSSLIVFMLYNVACIKYYKKYRISIIGFDKQLFVDTVKFSSWTLFGFFTSVLRTHATTLLINQWFNPVVVAARVISNTISSQLMIFANNLNVSLYPPIVRNYANKDVNGVNTILIEGSKISFFLVWLLALPMLVETEFFLKVWLVTPPVDSISFTRLALIEALLMSLGLVVGSAARATGKIKKYELILGAVQILTFVVTVFVLYIGYPAYSVFVIGIVTNLIMLFLRLCILQFLMGFSMKAFISKVLPTVSFMVITSSVFSVFLRQEFQNGWARVVVTLFIGTFFSFLVMYKYGLSAELKIKLK